MTVLAHDLEEVYAQDILGVSPRAEHETVSGSSTLNLNISELQEKFWTHSLLASAGNNSTFLRKLGKSTISSAQRYWVHFYSFHSSAILHFRID